MSDKEADLQIKEQLELYSDFIKFAWDSLDDNILTDDDNENVDMSLEAFFNLVKIACPILADLIWCVCVVSLYAVFLPIPSSMHKSLIVKSWSFIMSSFH